MKRFSHSAPLDARTSSNRVPSSWAASRRFNDFVRVRFQDFVRAERQSSSKGWLTELVQEKFHPGGTIVTSPRAERLAAILHRANRTLIPVPQRVEFLELKGAKNIQAMACPGPLVFVSGWLQSCASNPVFAFVIAHELAHIALGHFEAPGPELISVSRLVARRFTGRYQNELDADRLAHRWCIDAGFGDGGLRFFDGLRMQMAGRKLSSAAPSDESALDRWWRRRTDSHPPVDERIGRLREMDAYRQERVSLLRMG